MPGFIRDFCYIGFICRITEDEAVFITVCHQPLLGGGIFLGGIQAINPALYEAAEMDHATPWQKFKDITLPELKPLCVFVLITITIGAFRMLVQPMVMTGGGPSNSTYTVVYDIYETGTVNWEIGLASTMAIVFAFFVMILTVIQTIATRDKEDQNVNKKAKNN